MDDAFQVPLDGFTMHLRPSELAAVATGLGSHDTSKAGGLMTLAEAVRQMPIRERAPAWELLVRRYGRQKPLPRAAGEIGMDLIHARGLLERFQQLLPNAPPTET